MQTLIPNPVKQFVYIIETGRANGKVSVRIGKSKDVEQRRKMIAMYCPNAKVLISGTATFSKYIELNSKLSPLICCAGNIL